ncbi:MAG: enoyl-CoA hydratase/isomerase family protein [Hyphomicrobiaceae bacterium]
MATVSEFAGGKMLAEVNGAIGTMTFNQPEKRNAVSLEMWGGVAEILEKFEADDQIRVVVLAGAGDKAFVSGADISQFDKQRNNAEARKDYARLSDAGRNRLQTFGKPMIAKINGYCIGGGLAIAMRADLRIASEKSSFGIPAARLGIAYSPDSVEQLMALVGPARARMILYTAEFFDAQEAERIGLINRCVAAADLDASVRHTAETIAANAPLSVAASRHAISELCKPAARRDVAAIDAAVARCFDSDDYREGRRAFKEKRTPNFVGQ